MMLVLLCWDGGDIQDELVMKWMMVMHPPPFEGRMREKMAHGGAGDDDGHPPL